mmetsp:Transcript_25618/g.67691  ORF Transcript_25618/g.67691 Transcript_25618/m.67691 type:complete len:82 (-) Transcript_25618:51-296(-)
MTHPGHTNVWEFQAGMIFLVEFSDFFTLNGSLCDNRSEICKKPSFALVAAAKALPNLKVPVFHTMLHSCLFQEKMHYNSHL